MTKDSRPRDPSLPGAKACSSVSKAGVNESAKHKKKQSRKSGKKSHLALSVSSSSQLSAESSDGNSDGDTEALLSTSSQRDVEHQNLADLCCHSLPRRNHGLWFARFEAIAEDNNWSGQERLSVPLPKLQGAAGEYVFEVLSNGIRSDYKKLVQELDACYCKVESKQNYRRQLTGISQKPGESEQELAAEIC